MSAIKIRKSFDITCIELKISGVITSLIGSIIIGIIEEVSVSSRTANRLTSLAFNSKHSVAITLLIGSIIIGIIEEVSVRSRSANRLISLALNSNQRRNYLAHWIDHYWDH